ncbi:MAG TPA: ornithine cyclodeaminase family protein [Pyrinomonadaceae bacterium]|nr:ornithine cyclodeaminase family protein [Pyrinomonadaceae bacterium]
MRSKGTLLLTRRTVRELLSIEECIEAVEDAFRRYALGQTRPPGILGVHATGGGFHIKAGIMDQHERSYFVAKTNANFPNNRATGLPTIQGVIVVCDALNGSVLGLMDSIEITIIRTGAATAVAAKYLARENAKTALMCGCGSQGRISLEAIMKVRKLERAFAYDLDAGQASRFAEIMSAEIGIDVTPVPAVAKAARASDISVTCTTAREYFLLREHIMPGTFIAAVGADSEEKRELEPALLSTSKIVTDISEQSATIGELHHALEDGCVSLGDVHAELGEIVAGKRAGRTSEDEIIIFDSTGMALQDAAAAAIVYERALELGLGTRIDLND